MIDRADMVKELIMIRDGVLSGSVARWILHLRMYRH